MIFLFQRGGPSHLETFDRKPDATGEYRRPHRRMRSASLDIPVKDRRKRGYVHGASDETGSKPAESPITPDDVAATIYHLRGINSRSEITDAHGRPIMISSGNPILGIIA